MVTDGRCSDNDAMHPNALQRCLGKVLIHNPTHTTKAKFCRFFSAGGDYPLKAVMDDRELMREYVERRSEQAFAELVERHVNMVYATAFRLVRETHLAQDVSQSVFIELATKAKAVREGNALSGWLYRTTCCMAANQVRTEKRRRLSFSDRAELAALPDRIDAMEREREAVYASLGDPALLRDGSAVVAAKERLATLETDIEQATARWEMLETLAAEAEPT